MEKRRKEQLVTTKIQVFLTSTYRSVFRAIKRRVPIVMMVMMMIIMDRMATGQMTGIIGIMTISVVIV